MFDSFMNNIVEWVLGIATVVIFWILVVILVHIGSTPLPTCPDGYVLAGGGYAGVYHCVPGAEPIRG